VLQQVCCNQEEHRMNDPKAPEGPEATPAPPAESDTAGRLSRLQATALTSAATLIAFHGTALAAGAETASPERVIIGVPFLDPTTVAADGATIATIGAYRLMRRRRSAPPPVDPDTDA
jgi:hypothetical protein